MIKSMTAFAQSSNTHGTITADVTIRSYNSRHFDFVFYCPQSCQEFEENVKKILAREHDRGRMEVKLFVRDDAKDLDLFEVDEARAGSYFQALKKIKQDLNLSCEIGLADILSARDVIVPCKNAGDSKGLWEAIRPCIEAASSSLDLMRREEGKNLYMDLSVRIDYIEKNLKKMEQDSAQIPLLYKQRLMEKISRLTSDTDELDPVRISQEAALLADKSDISEEIVRLYSHIRQFRDILESDNSQGKKLNFLIQEFNREFNTIGSKAGNASLSHQVVDMKSELEKIREQVQNIE